MEYFKNTFCLNYAEMMAIMAEGTLKSLHSRGKLSRVRRACLETPALYAVDSLPEKYKVIAYQKYKELGDEERRQELIRESGLLLQSIQPSGTAMEYYATYKKPNGEFLSPAKQTEYYNNAIILDACRRNWERSYNHHARQGKRAQMVRKGDFWKRVADALPRVADKYPHSLPGNASRLRDKYESYRRGGYGTLINGRFGNQNRLKRTPKLESLILSVYGDRTKPFVTDVLARYNEFLLGQIEIVDVETGELYNRMDFYKNGFPITLTEASIWKIVNEPKNRRLVDLRRNDTLYNKTKHTPHHFRTSPLHSFSKISMDDRDLTRKTTANEKVCAYYSYDVASGCVVGASYSKTKDMDLVMDCFRDMFRFIDRHDMGMPMEVEVEHHLMEQIADDLAAMFPFVRFCAAGNSQEKRAEHFNRAKKYSAEKQLGQTNGRWWAHSEAYRERSERLGADYKESRLPYSQLVAEDMEAIAKYNNQLHPNQTQYPGMTRMQVLLDCVNPNLPRVNKPVVYKSVGYATKTTLRRSQYVQVQHARYTLPTPQMVERFKANNYECTAYWIPNEQGEIASVVLWQGDKFISECAKMVAYNESAAERTEADEQALQAQSKYLAQYHKMNKDGKAEKLHRIKIIRKQTIENALVESEKVIIENTEALQANTLSEYVMEDWEAKALKSV